MPGNPTTTGRIMVKAKDNIFFAINDADITIQEVPFVMDFEGLSAEVCQGDDLLLPFRYRTYGGFNEPVSFTATGAPAGLGISIDPASATDDDTEVEVLFTITAGVALGTYPITITASSSGGIIEVVIQLTVFNDEISAVTLTSPADGAIDVTLSPSLEWEPISAYNKYEVEISTDPAFNSILESSKVFFPTFKASMLAANTTYYWRVKPSNNCTEGAFGEVFSFTTTGTDCKIFSGKSLPANISAVGTPTITSSIVVIDQLVVSDINLTLQIDHTFLSDLVVSLTSPSGTEVTLIAGSCSSGMDLNATFDDDAPPFICSNNPAISGTVKPLGALSAFNGESTFGEWILTVSDTAPADGGSLNIVSLEVCGEGMFRPDEDQDGVFDDGPDLCLGTPPGAEVNTDGCEVFRFDPDTFTVEVESESCRGNNDGVITIITSIIRDYQVNISGSGTDVDDSFNNNFQLGQLSDGLYAVCITATEGQDTFEPFCFEVTIDQPPPLNVSSVISEDGSQAILNLSGASLYNIDLNGVLIQTEDPFIALDLAKGLNTLRVSTGQSCQGTYEEEIFISGSPIIFPNPFVESTTALLVDGTGPVEVAIFSSDGRLVRQQQSIGGISEFNLDFAGLPSGIYYVRLTSERSEESYKVVKK